MQVDNPGWLVEVSMLLVFSLVTVHHSIEWHGTSRKCSVIFERASPSR